MSTRPTKNPPSGSPHQRYDRAPLVDRRDVGPATIVALALGYAGMWLAIKPADEPWSWHLGEAIGAEAVLLMSIALVLISTLPWVESWFDGIDRAAVWHRRFAAFGTALLILHVPLAHSRDRSTLGPALATIGAWGLGILVVWALLPRWRDVTPAFLRTQIDALRGTPVARFLAGLIGPYGRWRGFHRLTGLFVTAGFIHGVLDGETFAASSALRNTYLAVGGIGVLAYLYRELLSRHLLPMHDYQVAEVNNLGGGITELVLVPLGKPLTFKPGQFAMVYLEVKDGWHRHPFSITSGAGDDRIRFTVKALGDWTSRVPELIRPGMPAVISGPHGRFLQPRRHRHQVWIAAGVGVAPFLSWARSLDGNSRVPIDFFLSAEGAQSFDAELEQISARFPVLRLHLIDTSTRGRLTAAEVLDTVDAAPADLSVFLCGPTAMVQSFAQTLRQAGVPKSAILWEHFDWR
ncbi:MAG: hypothetical protein ACK5MT_04765 [Actinomycetales bacterium]